MAERGGRPAGLHGPAACHHAPDGQRPCPDAGVRPGAERRAEAAGRAARPASTSPSGTPGASCRGRIVAAAASGRARPVGDAGARAAGAPPISTRRPVRRCGCGPPRPGGGPSRRRRWPGSSWSSTTSTRWSSRRSGQPGPAGGGFGRTGAGGGGPGRRAARRAPGRGVRRRRTVRRTTELARGAPRCGSSWTRRLPPAPDEPARRAGGGWGVRTGG